MKLSMHASYFGTDNNRHFLENPMLYKELVNDKNKKLIWDIICTITYMILQPFAQISALYTSFDYVRKTINYSTNK